MADRPTPENCPEPFWHDTHRYCPACSWTEPQEAPKHSPVARNAAMQALFDLVNHDQPDGMWNYAEQITAAILNNPEVVLRALKGDYDRHNRWWIVDIESDDSEDHDDAVRSGFGWR